MTDAMLWLMVGMFLGVCLCLMALGALLSVDRRR